MLDFREDQEGYVQQPRFTMPVEPFYSALDHEELATKFFAEQYRYGSIIVIAQRLRKDLWNDPRYMRQTNHILCSEIKEEARRRLQNRYMSVDQVKRILEERTIPFRANHDFLPAAGESEEDRRFRMQLEELVWDAQENTLLETLFEEYKEETKWKYDEETGEEIELSHDESARAWEKRLLELFLPRVRTEYARMYAMPEPLCFWDDRNQFQQWFLWTDMKKIYYAQGGSGSSGQREAMGRYAHLFAFLAIKHHVEAPTWVLLYTEDNRLRVLEQSKRFYAINRELTGNYRPIHEDTRTLFQGRLLHMISDHQVELS